MAELLPLKDLYSPLIAGYIEIDQNPLAVSFSVSHSLLEVVEISIYPFIVQNLFCGLTTFYQKILSISDQPMI